MNKLTFKVLGSGFLILMPATDLPEPYNAVHFGMIDKEVDGFYYWCPDKDAISKGTIFPAWVLRGIADEIDKLNLVQECNEAAARLTPDRAAALKKLFDVEGKKPYSMGDLEATKFTRSGQNYLACDHKFVDSNCCLKCGWIPG